MIALAAAIVAAHVSNNNVALSDVGALVQGVHAADEGQSVVAAARSLPLFNGLLELLTRS